MPDSIYKELIKLAKKASKKLEVPVSAIITKEDKIIAKAYNHRQKKNNPLNHAEIIAIQKACKKIHDWRLSDCILYITLEPCSMCSEIIKQTRIKEVHYMLTKEPAKKEFFKTKFIKANNSTQNEHYHEIIKNFFLRRRQR